MGTAWKETWLRNTNHRRKAVIHRMLEFEEGILQKFFFFFGGVVSRNSSREGSVFVFAVLVENAREEAKGNEEMIITFFPVPQCNSYLH